MGAELELKVTIKPAGQAIRREAARKGYTGWVTAAIRQGTGDWNRLDDMIRAIPGVRQGVCRYLPIDRLCVPPGSVAHLSGVYAECGKALILREL